MAFILCCAQIFLNNCQIYAFLILGIEFIEQFSKLLSLKYFIGVFIDLFEFYRSVFDKCCDDLFEEAYLLNDELNVHLFRQLLSIIFDLLILAKK